MRCDNKVGVGSLSTYVKVSRSEPLRKSANVCNYDRLYLFFPTSWRLLYDTLKFTKENLRV